MKKDSHCSIEFFPRFQFETAGRTNLSDVFDFDARRLNEFECWRVFVRLNVELKFDLEHKAPL